LNFYGNRFANSNLLPASNLYLIFSFNHQILHGGKNSLLFFSLEENVWERVANRVPQKFNFVFAKN
jgi:hypothetical protein